MNTAGDNTVNENTAVEERPVSDPTERAPTSLSEVLDRHHVVVCCGTGGVGKTTTAAALALEGARRGRTAVVVTIDPARRLADALGLDQLSNQPHRVALDAPGQLWAVMLDASGTFDDVVSRYAGSVDQAEQIVANRFYRNISRSLSGAQEYMAAEKLYELRYERDFDLVVVDTPPSRNALDFLDAPGRLVRMLDSRVYRVLTAPNRGVFRPVGLAAQGLLRSLAKVVGAAVVDDAIGFFQLFEGMEPGFRERASQVMGLLTDDSTAFVLVASPRPDTVAGASRLATRLASSEIAVRALVVNRMHPLFGDGRVALEEVANLAEEQRRGGNGAAADTLDNLVDHLRVARREEDGLTELRTGLGAAVTARVPMLPTDIHDVAALAGLHRYLFDG